MRKQPSLLSYPSFPSVHGSCAAARVISISQLVFQQPRLIYPVAILKFSACEVVCGEKQGMTLSYIFIYIYVFL